MQSVWEEHFVWPFQGKVTATQVALSLGLLQDREPLFSLYHTDKAIPLSREIYRKIWAWCLSHIKSRRKVLYNLPVGGSLPLIPSYQAVLHREQECRTHSILEFQRNPLPHRVENFRAIGPLRFVAVDGPKRYLFSLVQRGAIAKFKVGDYLKLSPVGSSHLQEGFSVILESYCPDQGRVVVRSLLRRITIHPHQMYVLDECAEDRNTPKMQAVLQQCAQPHFRPEILQLLQGRAPPSLGSTEWVEKWDLAHAALSRLNASQKQALFLPFVKNVGLIEGPPGTGKTHLLVWTIVALCAYARSLDQHIKILVTAQTHQAIDQILKKTAQVLKTLSMEGITLWKRGRYDPLLFGRCGVQSLEEATQLLQEPLCIVGATGFGIYQLFEGARFPQIFDWVVFDESSQVLPAYALLGLIFGKGKAIFYGDTQQLPPVILGNYEDTSFPPRSILEELILRYPSDHRVRLRETYRMNDKICRFVSQNWYENELFSGVPQESQRWDLPRYPLFGDSLDAFLDPSRPMEVVFVSHEGSQQSSREEAIWIAEAVKRCVQDYCVPVEEIGIISPHRLQNNTIGSALKEALPFATQLPKVDTVERMQGAEFDVVFFSATVSDLKTLHTPFLRDYRRLNVALTRARKKCIFVASPLFFHTFPMHEKQLRSHLPFLAFLQAAFPI